ncbi:hypothetical protein H9L17_04490 [Thermomonas brevis]|uniref:Uncharacterized protein n=1 Tax=Thermomonas brevis TaxID=215691 RepID=A0A7G9QVN6_9GAMM|nr:hypothetical protein [Thermomonas brevis]QNN47411.1 hypothetical protein H9L17_04490 [Thermomonas brevis]
MPDNTKATHAVLRALLDEMAKSLAAPKAQEPPAPGTRRTRVNVKEFNKGQQGENWWSDGGDEDEFIGLRPRPKPRARRRLR